MGSHRKLGVKSDHRVAMLRNMTADLITYGRITTTVTRAKELRRVAERIITLGKRGDPVSYTHLDVYKRQRHNCVYRCAG